MRRRERLLDTGLFLALVVGYVALLLGTTHDLGYARDEGFYFRAADAYGRWFRLLVDNPDAAMSRAMVDRHWTNNHEHPALIKSLFALSHELFHVKWRLFEEAGTSYRFPGMVLSGLAVGVTYLWGRRAISRTGGLVAAVLFAAMPRVFYHSHLDCFDMPVLAMWLVTTYAYWRSVAHEGGWRTTLGWALTTGVLYGLLLNTKHNSWLLPGALLVHLVFWRGRTIWREFKRGRFSIPWALLSMGVIGPLVFYALWPWLWFDTGARLVAYARFHLHHDYYNMEFLGQTYWLPPMPRAYAPVMTLATVPSITLLLFMIGTLTAGATALTRSGVGRRVAARFRRPETFEPEVSETGSADVLGPAGQTELLWLLCLLLSYAPWLSKTTPIFGGTKHWITAYPFMCLFAARGFLLVLARLRRLAPIRLGSWPPRIALFACCVAAPILTTAQSHPWGLSAYVPLVGGAPGAASLGLNRGFWGYQTGAAAEFLNAHSPPRGEVYLHDTTRSSWAMLQRDGRIRSDLRGGLNISKSDVALYHHEPHMLRVEYQIWVDYGTRSPAWVGTHDGVPVAWVYRRPARERQKR